MNYAIKFNSKVVDIATKNNEKQLWYYLYILVDKNKFKTKNNQNIPLTDKLIPDALRELLQKNLSDFEDSTYHSEPSFNLYRLLDYYIDKSSIRGFYQYENTHWYSDDEVVHSTVRDINYVDDYQNDNLVYVFKIYFDDYFNVI